MEQQPTSAENSDMQAHEQSLSGQKAMSRRSLMRGGLITGAVVAPMGVMVAVAHAQQAGRPVLNTLTPHNRSTAEFPRAGSVSSAFVEIQSDENAHVKFLTSALGSKAIKKPRFNFHGTNKHVGQFVTTATLLIGSQLPPGCRTHQALLQRTTTGVIDGEINANVAKFDNCHNSLAYSQYATRRL